MSKLSTTQEILRVATVAVVIFLWFVVSPTTALFWSIFLVWAVFKLDSRLVGGGALALLVLVPIALSFPKYEAWAEPLAVYVFFLLCITVGLQILEMWLEPAADEELKEDVVVAKGKSSESDRVSIPNYTEVELQKVHRAPRMQDIKPAPKPVSKLVSKPTLKPAVKPVRKVERKVERKVVRKSM